MVFSLAMIDIEYMSSPKSAQGIITTLPAPIGFS
jgi:hypothetical protein